MIIKPKKMVLGDSIGLISPARKSDTKLLELGCQIIEKMGYRPVLLEERASHTYLAGSDAERLDALQRLWEREDVKALWATAGGYGTMRLLGQVDFALAKQQPKILIGMSDLTALHLGLQKQGIASFLGPCLVSFNRGSEQEQMLNWLNSALTGAAIQIDLEETEVICSGMGEGRLVGGNLCLIASLMGTPWELDTEGKILLIEEVGEEPYRIDRMLCQLKSAGKLENLSGLILASFTDCEPENPEKAIHLHEVIDHYFKNASYPVINGFPSGHIACQRTLPLGCRAQLDTEKRSLVFLEAGVE